MNARVRTVVERILELRNEFEDLEILEAIRYVNSTLHQNSTGVKQPKNRKSKTNSSRGTGARTAIPKASRVVLALKETDPEKYDVLTDLDSLLREGKILSSLDAIRTVGASLNKSFVAGKSRKDAIPKLMKLLADLPLDQLRGVVESLLEQSSDKRRSSDEETYSKLAAFLIHGK